MPKTCRQRFNSAKCPSARHKLGLRVLFVDDLTGKQITHPWGKRVPEVLIFHQLVKSRSGSILSTGSGPDVLFCFPVSRCSLLTRIGKSPSCLTSTSRAACVARLPYPPMWLWEKTSEMTMTNQHHTCRDSAFWPCNEDMLSPMPDTIIAARSAKRMTLSVVGPALVGLGQLGLKLL